MSNTNTDWETARNQRQEEEAKKAKKQALVNSMKTGAAIIGGLVLITGFVGLLKSTIVDEGNFGIEKHLGGTYNTQALSSGWHGNMLDKIYEVYGKESLIKIEDVRPKDKSGIMLKDLDLNISVKANKENAVPFLLKTGDVSYDSEKGVYYLGTNHLPKEARSVANQTIRKFESEELIDKQNEVEESFKQDFQEQLNKLYGKGTFTVTDVKLANVQFSDAVEEKIQSIEFIRAEEAKATATDKILNIRNEMLNKEVKGLQEVAKANDISFNQLLDYQKTKVLMEGKVQAQITMPASTEAPKPAK